MVEIAWTSEQKKGMDTRNANILVSAAAGSGKTAVLVERILKRVLDERSPVDVDRFVVVTFTKAAAAQMKERLRSRLEKELEKAPENIYLQRQMGLVSSAHISTVHSFCGYVIQNYFHRIGLDPSYRQGTESELALLMNETMEAILEEEYELGKDDFTELAGLRIFNRSDDAMRDMVFLLYDKAMSEPFPEEWLLKMEQMLTIRTEEEWENSAICRQMIQEVTRLTAGLKEEQKQLLEICKEPDGPYYFESRIEELGELLEELSGCETYQEMHFKLADMKFSAMRTKKDEGVNPEKKEAVAERRNACKEELKKIQEDYFLSDTESLLQELAEMSAPLLTLIRLTRQFLFSYTEAKRERNIVDFNDLEQLALEILLERDEKTGEHRRSAAAEELSDYFEEIMIDEYQDSNRVQDTLLSCVSRAGREGMAPNLFMVGDVKQSIYRFRNACPQLFSEKLTSYKSEEGTDCIRIDLHQNFRSRDVVLEGTNAVFERIMREDIGGVEYDTDARLQQGKQFPDSGERTADAIDLYVIMDNAQMEYEGRQAVQCIRDMMNPADPLYILGEDGYRPVTYRDIVILVRSVRTMGQPVFDVLAEAGIPVVMEHTQGFFDTREIGLMTAMLQVVDNPRQDIPLAAVLVSPMFGFSEEELARIRVNTRDKCLYDSLMLVREEKINAKIDRFLETLMRLREKISYAAVAELIQDIYRETGIYESVMMMKDGAQRIANMDRLMELAREFDETTYHGLYQFVRYINRIREQQEEMGEVNIVGEEEDVVRIMTMHKSKGLEFPVCILMGLGKKLSHANRSFLTIHQELGIASMIQNAEKHTKKDNVFRSFLARKNALEDLGEEMRVLYVAMTRAKEKLILIGSEKENELECGPLNYLGRSHMKSYLDMLLPAVLSGDGRFCCQFPEKESLLEETVSDIVEERIEKEALNTFDTSIRYDEETHQLLERIETAGYEEAMPLPVKVSVSDLKMKSMEELDAEDFTILSHEEPEDEMPVPSFLKEKVLDDAHQGAAYGTIWHQVMATIDFSKTGSEQEIKEAVEMLVQTGRLRRDETAVLNYKKLFRFFCSELGGQMKKAAEEGMLHREQPFVISRPARELFPGRKETDDVLVQGIIDGYYETPDGIVLMDYKTDSLKPGEENKLVERYQTQMALYKEALETMMDKPVTACVLYSFSLGKEIYVKESED